jgi:hypothetical protein
MLLTECQRDYCLIHRCRTRVNKNYRDRLMRYQLGWLYEGPLALSARAFLVAAFSHAVGLPLDVSV